MEDVVNVKALLLLLFFIGRIAGGVNPEQTFGLSDGMVVLTPTLPSATSKITRILWKHGNDKAAEWEEGDLAPDYYGIYKEKTRTKLNISTGVLTISILSDKYNGRYSVEINGQSIEKAYNLIVIDPVSKPIIESSCSDSICNLTCKGKGTENVRYEWTGSKKVEGDKLTVSAEDIEDILHCNFSNPLSSAQSDPVHVRDLFPSGNENAGKAGNTSVIITVIVCVISAILLGGLAYIFRKWLAGLFQKKPGPAMPESQPLNRFDADAKDNGNVPSHGETINETENHEEKNSDGHAHPEKAKESSDTDLTFSTENHEEKNSDGHAHPEKTKEGNEIEENQEAEDRNNQSQPGETKNSSEEGNAKPEDTSPQPNTTTDGND